MNGSCSSADAVDDGLDDVRDAPRSPTCATNEMRTRLAESMAAPRAEAVLALINARPNSPTAEEIRSVLAPPRTPVPAWADADVRSADAGVRTAEENGSYYDDPDCEIAICAHAASANIPRLKRESPDLSGPHLWLEAIKRAREAGLSIDPLD